MKKYAIWKNHKVIGYIELTEIGYIELTEEQRQLLNGISGIGVCFGFDKTTQLDKYAKNFTKKYEKTL